LKARISAAPVPAPEPCGLTLRAEGLAPALVVFLKDHCLAERVESLPEALEKSIEHIVNKMVTPSSWGLFYESITEELGFRAKAAASALSTSHARIIQDLLTEDISLTQERMCLPVWKSASRRSSAELMTSLSRLRVPVCEAEVRRARRDLLRQASLEWCEIEDLTAFMDGHLGQLEIAIDNFRGAQEASSKAHTPHLRDIGRLMFRNNCLLDSRVFKALCLSAYALVHEVSAAEEGSEDRHSFLELLESVHAMLSACDVADDHLSVSKNTKDTFVENLMVPITAATDHLGEWDIKGHPSCDETHRHRGGRC